MDNNKGLDQADGLREEVQKESNKLPSRSELHAQKRDKKTKWKVNFPFVRLIGVLFLLIPISIMAIHFNNQETNFLDKMFTPAVKNVEQITLPSNASASTVDNGDNNDKDDEEKPIVAEKEYTKDVKAQEAANQGEADGPGKTAEKEESKTATEQSDATPVSQPETEEKDATEEQVEEDSTNVTYVEHIVQESETLYRISMKYFSSRDGERIISDHNNLVNDQVNVGQKLLIPINR
ncbi:LysM peptidoglycan-binding domain-containing protein [Sutcliffiella horikoshii]|uniref:LysM peptidoglycan-binding domain-containing protein n=1 Tax=Sutcliffiella horikoshii TaxID=79883 RepID=UPI001CFF3B32|nr:LysM peptidoglycan-binding domain-containing protein [Sutcliffiella horikoshii]